MQHDEDYYPEDGGEFQPPNPLSYEELLNKVVSLQRRLGEVETSAVRSLPELSDDTIYDLTGFPSLKEARSEYEKAGGDTVFGQLHRHGTSLDPALIDKAAMHVREQFPGLSDETDLAHDAVLCQRGFCEEKKDPRGRKPVVEPFAVFLLVMMYVHGGVLEFMAPFLPGIGCGQSQFSRILDNATPLIVEKWAKLYYKKRDLNWLIENAGPDRDRSQYAGERQFAGDLEGAVIVLGIDGLIPPRALQLYAELANKSSCCC